MLRVGNNWLLFLLTLFWELAGKVVAKFCAKFLHQQVLRSEAYSAGDIGTALQKAFFRLLHLVAGSSFIFFFPFVVF